MSRSLYPKYAPRMSWHLRNLACPNIPLCQTCVIWHAFNPSSVKVMRPYKKKWRGLWSWLQCYKTVGSQSISRCCFALLVMVSNTLMNPGRTFAWLEDVRQTLLEFAAFSIFCMSVDILSPWVAGTANGDSWLSLNINRHKLILTWRTFILNSYKLT
jgi:hypothetical protein